MSLIQIQEPQFKNNKGIIGIDLGTTYSLVAYVEDNIPQILADSNGSVKVPSIVEVYQSIDKEQRVGQDALSASATSIKSVKRLIGHSYSDLINDKNLSVDIVATDKDMPLIKTPYGNVSPIEVSAHILSKLKSIVSIRSQVEISGAVITVPAHFDDAQRQATKDAAKIANIPLLRLLNEPTAAALAYGLDKDKNGLIAIYDLGGGTFDISILELTDGVFKVLATGGNTNLGGDDIDNLVSNLILEDLNIPVEALTNIELQQLKSLGSQFKEQLTHDAEVTLDISVSGKEKPYTITRDRFNTIIANLVESTLTSVAGTLVDCRLSISDINSVVMIGGCTRVPYIQQQVGNFFQTTPLTDINPDTAVCKGAALYANSLMRKDSNTPLLIDVNPLSLGIEVAGGLVAILIKRNTSIPASVEQDFTTQKHNQTAIVLHIVQGERELVADCRSLGKIYLRDLPPMPVGKLVVTISFSLDADGILQVRAVEKSTNKEVSTAITPSYGLDSETIEKMIKDSYNYASDDISKSSHIKLLMKAGELLESTRSALQAELTFMESSEISKIETAVKQLESAIEEKDAPLVEQNFKILNQLSNALADQQLQHILRNSLNN